MKYTTLKIFLFSFITLCMVSCLKKANMNIDPSKGTNNIIEFANTDNNVSGSSSTYPGFHIDLGSLAIGGSASFKINVAYSGAETAPSDITVNLSLYQSTLDIYNTQNGTSFVIPPADIFTLPASAVIKKGTRLGQAEVKINNTSNFDFNASYGLPVKITSVSTGTVSSNFGNAVYSIGLRNIYDGIYSVSSGTVTRYLSPGSPANDALSGSVTGNPDLTLNTIDGNTVEVGNLKWHGGASGVGGIDNLRITIDPATNLVTMSALGNATLSNWSGHENKYDPATQTFYLAFIWNPTGSVRTYEMVIKYKGPR